MDLVGDWSAEATGDGGVDMDHGDGAPREDACGEVMASLDGVLGFI